MNNVKKENPVKTSTFPKGITTDVPFWVRESKLETEDQLFDVCNAVMEGKTTQFCIPERGRDRILYLIPATNWVLKILLKPEYWCLRELWKNCPLYDEELTVDEWYALYKEEYSMDLPQNLASTNPATEANDPLGEILRGFFSRK